MWRQMLIVRAWGSLGCLCYIMTRNLDARLLPDIWERWRRQAPSCLECVLKEDVVSLVELEDGKLSFTHMYFIPYSEAHCPH